MPASSSNASRRRSISRDDSESTSTCMSGWRSQNGEVDERDRGQRRRDRPDAQRPLEPAADLRQLVSETVEVGQDAMRPEHDPLALAREPLEALPAPDERHAELGLELAQTRRERRLRDVAGARARARSDAPARARRGTRAAAGTRRQNLLRGPPERDATLNAATAASVSRTRRATTSARLPRAAQRRALPGEHRQHVRSALLGGGTAQIARQRRLPPPAERAGIGLDERVDERLRIQRAGPPGDRVGDDRAVRCGRPGARRRRRPRHRSPHSRGSSVPSDTPWAPSASAAAIPRPSMMPPEAITGMPGPDGIHDLRDDARLPTSAADAGAVALADTEGAAVASGLATLRDHGVGAAGDGPRGLVDRRHHRQQTRARGARRLGDGRGVVECRDHGCARGEPGLDQRDRRVGHAAARAAPPGARARAGTASGPRGCARAHPSPASAARAVR